MRTCLTIERMSAAVSEVSFPDAVAHLLVAMDELHAASLTSCTDDEIENVLCDLEIARRKFAPLDHALIAETKTRSLASKRGQVTAATYLKKLLRISPAEARGRVKAAESLGPRLSMTGERLDPIYPD